MERRYARILTILQTQGHYHFRDTSEEDLDQLIEVWERHNCVPNSLRRIGAGRTWTLTVPLRIRVIEHRQAFTRLR